MFAQQPSTLSYPDTSLTAAMRTEYDQSFQANQARDIVMCQRDTCLCILEFITEQSGMLGLEVVLLRTAPVKIGPKQIQRRISRTHRVVFTRAKHVSARAALL